MSEPAQELGEILESYDSEKRGHHDYQKFKIGNFGVRNYRKRVNPCCLNW